jgi:hypothetical protein
MEQFDGTLKRMQINLTTGERQINRSSNINKNIRFGFFEIEQIAHVLETLALLATSMAPQQL